MRCSDPHPKLLEFLVGHAVAIVDHLNGIVLRIEVDQDCVGVGVVAVFYEFRKRHMVPTNEALPQFS